jgi:hypothetical protein
VEKIDDSTVCFMTSIDMASGIYSLISSEAMKMRAGLEPVDGLECWKRLKSTFGSIDHIRATKFSKIERISIYCDDVMPHSHATEICHFLKKLNDIPVEDEPTPDKDIAIIIQLRTAARPKPSYR